jgi:hypothetical protein
MSLFRFVVVMTVLVLYALASAAYQNIKESQKDLMSYRRDTRKVNGITISGQDDLMRLRLAPPGMGSSSLAFPSSSQQSLVQSSQVPSR